MREIINEEVSVAMYYSAKKRVGLPYIVSWQEKEYKVGKIGYQHKVYDGKVCHHIYEFVDSENNLWFRLNFNTDNLHWLLEAVSDGQPS